MIRGSRWRGLGFALTIATLAACGGAQKPSGKSEATDEFERCRAEEQAGPASGCWKHFVDKYASTASSAELMIAKEHASTAPKAADTSVATQAPPAPAPPPQAQLDHEGPSGTLTHETPAQPPPAPAAPSMTGNIIADLLAIPDPGSSAWDDSVEARLLHEYDTNHSGKVDSDAELQKMPCQAWMALESRLWGARNISVSRLYGFAPGFAWVGNALGFAEPMRQKTFDRMKTCGVDPTHAPHPGQVPTAPASASAGSSTGLVGELAAIPNAGSSDWDTAVKTRMLHNFDDNHSGAIEREAELKKIPCNVFTTLETRLQAQQHISVARLYGFAPGFGWVGNALGFAEPLREKAYAAMRACGVDNGSPMPSTTTAEAPRGPILSDLAAIPDAGSTPWDHAVKARLVREYDTNHNGDIDTESELQKIPCTVFAVLETRLQAAQHIAVSRLYGFAPSYNWVGHALGFNISLRQKAYARMLSCNLPG